MIAPRKRKLGLPVGRGSRRNAAVLERCGDAAAAPGAFAESGRPARGPRGAPRPRVRLQPAPPEPAGSAPLVDESGVPYTPPDPTEEKQVAIWLTSYLAATGHAADETRQPTTTANGSARDPDTGSGLPTAADAAVPLPRTHRRNPRSRSTLQRCPADRPTPPDDAAPSVTPLVRAPRGSVAPRALAAPCSPRRAVRRRVPEHRVDAVPEAVPTRSLADLAGLTEPAPEPEPAPSGAAAGEEPSPTRGGPAQRALASGSRRRRGARVDGRGLGDPQRRGGEPALAWAREPSDDVAPEAEPARSRRRSTRFPMSSTADGEVSVEAGPIPGRPRTVPPVTLSWREAESFEIGVPGVEDSEGAIVVEAPSQLVAQRRGRRRDLAPEDAGRSTPSRSEPSSPLPRRPPSRRSPPPAPRRARHPGTSRASDVVWWSSHWCWSCSRSWPGTSCCAPRAVGRLRRRAGPSSWWRAAVTGLGQARVDDHRLRSRVNPPATHRTAAQSGQRATGRPGDRSRSAPPTDDSTGIARRNPARCG